MMAKPVKTLELHYPTIQFLIIVFITLNCGHDVHSSCLLSYGYGEKSYTNSVALVHTQLCFEEQKGKFEKFFVS